MTHIINPTISTRQRNVITGTLLGGSSIVTPTKGRGSYLSMRNHDLNWLYFKARELTTLSSKSPVLIEKTNRWHSLCYPIFQKYKEMFYENNKRCLTLKCLEEAKIADIALAIWFGDCGKRLNGQVVLNTNMWGQKGTDVIVEYLHLISCPCESWKERESLRVRLTDEGT